MSDERIWRAVRIAEAVSTAIEFMASFDAGDVDGAVALFAEDAIWRRQDGVVEGKQSLKDLMARRDPKQVVRHVITNVRAEHISFEAVTIRSYVTLFSHRASTTQPSFPLPLDGVAGFGRYEDEMRLIDGRWHLYRKASVTEFRK